MPIVRVPDGRQVRFPDDMSREQIKAIITEKFPQQRQEPLTQDQLDSLRTQAEELNKQAGIDTSGWSVAKEGLKGAGKGLIGGIERLGAGATFGLTDWIGDKLGTGVKERRQELEDMNGAIKGLNVGLDIAGGIPTGGALFKGLSAGAKAVPYAGKALKYLVPTASGAIQGGLYSGFENDSLGSAGKGAVVGGALGGALDLVGRGAGKLFSAVEKVKNAPRGFENAVGTKEGARILNRAVRESDDIAERVYGKAPEALDNLNVRAMDKLDDAVKGGVDVKGRMAGAKKAYGDFIDENKANQVVKGKNTLYHGTDKNFDVFNTKNKNGYGAAYFTDDKEIASKFGKNIKEATVDLKKPLIVDANGSMYDSIVPPKGMGKDYTFGSKTVDTNSIAAFARDKGYDGVIVKNVKEAGKIGTDYLAFDPSQIKNQAVKVSDLDITGLTDNQKSWLNQAWTAGKRNTLEKAGSLGHLDEMSKELNKMVQGSRLANPNGVGTIATPETVALQGLKDKVDDVIEKAGLQNIKAQYRQAKALEDSFNQGLNFNPNSVKTRNITFKTPDEQSAFAQGLVERVKMNPESKNIAGKTRDLRGALRKALGEKADGVFKEMDNINKSYKNVEKVLGNAERKLSVPEPINGKVGLLREFVESPGSVVGGLADFARRWATAKSAERAAKYLLDPTLKLGNSPYEAIRQYAPTIGGLGIGNLIRKGE